MPTAPGRAARPRGCLAIQSLDTALSRCWWWVVLGDFVAIKHRLRFAAASGTKATSRALSASTARSLNSPRLPCGLWAAVPHWRLLSPGLFGPPCLCLCYAGHSGPPFPFPHFCIPHTYPCAHSPIDSRVLAQCLFGARLLGTLLGAQEKSYPRPPSCRRPSPSSPSPTDKEGPARAWIAPAMWPCAPAGCRRGGRVRPASHSRAAVPGLARPAGSQVVWG